ncbi:MAG: HpcH/HpaI aldolase/citrate lyase family protein [Chloroflexi bacterium]|nr:HpcH/HpaI aldolase/citrate lyase family protein [Chloroflexota bacterium]
MLITNRPDIAQAAEAAGVDRIFVDLERLGKLERQGHLDTHISDHAFEDIANLRPSVNKAQILARINPINIGTPHEVEQVLSMGADIVMLPMFRTRKEVSQFVNLVGGRGVALRHPEKQ